MSSTYWEVLSIFVLFFRCYIYFCNYIRLCFLKSIFIKFLYCGRKHHFRNYFVSKCIASNSRQTFRKCQCTWICQVFFCRESISANLCYCRWNMDLCKVVTGKSIITNLGNSFRNCNTFQLCHIILGVTASKCCCRNLCQSF